MDGVPSQLNRGEGLDEGHDPINYCAECSYGRDPIGQRTTAFAAKESSSHRGAQSPGATIAPSAIACTCLRTVGFCVSFRKTTPPSARSALHPPGWRLPTCCQEARRPDCRRKMPVEVQ